MVSKEFKSTDAPRASTAASSSSDAGGVPAASFSSMPSGRAASTRPAPSSSPFPIDKADINDPQCVPEYIEDIMRHYRHTEAQFTVNPGYIAQQVELNEKVRAERTPAGDGAILLNTVASAHTIPQMRAILVDWLVEVHLKFKLSPETMYLTVNIIDRYLEKKVGLLSERSWMCCSRA